MTTLGELHGKVVSVDDRLGRVQQAVETARQENREEFAAYRIILQEIEAQFRQLNGTVGRHEGRIETLEGDVSPLHAERLARLAVRGFLGTVRGRVVAGLAISGGVLTITSAAVMLAQAIVGAR